MLDYVALGLAALAVLYFGLHGMLFEHFIRQQLSSIPRLRYNRRHKCFYTQMVCCSCGSTIRQRLPYGMLDIEALEVLLDDSIHSQICNTCRRR